MAPILITTLLKMSWDGDDEPEDVALKIAKESLLYAGSSLPVFDDALDAAVGGRRPSGNPWLTTMWKTAQAGGAGVLGDEPLTDGQVRDLINGLGMFTRTPTAAGLNAYKYLEGLQDGTLKEPVRDLLFRSPGEFK